MDIWSFRSRYPELCGFLGAWFPETDLEGLTDDEAAARFAGVTAPEEVAAALEQGERVLAAVPFPWEETGEQANRHFENAELARYWLTRILAVVQSASAGSVDAPAKLEP